MATIRPLRALAAQVVADEIIRDPVPYVPHMSKLVSMLLPLPQVRMTSVYGYVLPPNYYWKLIDPMGCYAGIAGSEILMISPTLRSERITYPGYRVLSVIPDLSRQLMCVVLENMSGYHFNIVSISKENVKSHVMHSVRTLPTISPRIGCFQVSTIDGPSCLTSASYGFTQKVVAEVLMMGTMNVSIIGLCPLTLNVNGQHYVLRSECIINGGCIYFSTQTENIVISSLGIQRIVHQQGDIMVAPSIVSNVTPGSPPHAGRKLFLCGRRHRSEIQSIKHVLTTMFVVGRNKAVYVGKCFHDGLFIGRANNVIEDASHVHVGMRYYRYHDRHYILSGWVGEINDPKGIMKKIDPNDIYYDGDKLTSGQFYIINPANGCQMSLCEILSMRLRLVEL